jgi:hypothetical protein
MNQDFNEDASDSVPSDREIRITARDIDDARAGLVVWGGSVVTTAQNSLLRSDDRRGEMGPADLEWEFLTRWGLLKSPFRWNVPHDEHRQ